MLCCAVNPIVEVLNLRFDCYNGELNFRFSDFFCLLCAA